MVSPNGNYLNGNGTHVLDCPSDYEPAPIIDVTPSAPKPAWRNDFPLFTHNLSWVDGDGCSHSLTLRSDDLPGLFADLKLLKGLIRASREKAKEKHPDAPEAQAQPDTQHCSIHDVDMMRRWSKRTQGHYFGHKCSDGSFCYGKKGK
jgi:hypothetical protein